MEIEQEKKIYLNKTQMNWSDGAVVGYFSLYGGTVEAPSKML